MAEGIQEPHSPGPLRRLSGHTGKLIYGSLVGALVALGIAWLVGAFKSHAPPEADQVRKIELTEHRLRDGKLQSAQSTALHGDGTRSWVFVFLEHDALYRLVIYDIDHKRLREQIVLTSRSRQPAVPSTIRRKALRNGWLQLHGAHIVFERPVPERIQNDSRMLLVPVTAITPEPRNPADGFRQTVFAVFWSPDQGDYVVHRLDRGPGRWTLRPSDLQLELRQGHGFRTLPTATKIKIDTRSRRVFAVVGFTVIQVHAFGFPTGPSDLEECPVYAAPQPPAPIGLPSKLSQFERKLSAGCPRT
jgi:hypothetical protein